MTQPISFTVVLKFATRFDGSTQVITLGTLSFRGRVLGQFRQTASNVFQLDLMDRTVLFDPSLSTNAGDHPKTTVTLSFTDDRGEISTFDQKIGIECTGNPRNFDQAYFCGGACQGIYPSFINPAPTSCRGCNLACSYTPPGGSPTTGTCTTYNVASFTGWAESCGVFVPGPQGSQVPDLTQSCDQICAKYTGRGKPGKCADRCYANNQGASGGYGSSTGSAYGGVGGIVAADFSLTGKRGLVIDCPVTPAAYIAGLPADLRPINVFGFSCCCSFD